MDCLLVNSIVVLLVYCDNFSFFWELGGCILCMLGFVFILIVIVLVVNIYRGMERVYFCFKFCFK